MLPRKSKAAAKFHFTVRNTRLVSDYAWENYPNVYGKAMNLVSRLSNEYDEAMKKFDLLVLPAVNYPIRRHPPPGSTPLQQAQKFLGQPLHIAPFNISEHPALSSPCSAPPPVEADIVTESYSDTRIPTAFQIVGKCFDKTMIYRATSAWEKYYDWRNI